MNKVRTKLHQPFQQFYERNAASLKAVRRSESLVYGLFALETLYLFSLLLSPKFISQNSTEQLLMTLSVHYFSTSTLKILASITLILNVGIFSLFMYIFIRFCLKPNQPTKRNQYFSNIIMNYNTCISIPSIVFASKLVANNDSIMQRVLCIINLVFTVIFSCINSMHSTKSYSFFGSVDDAMAKFGSMWDYFNYPLLIIQMVVIEALNEQEGYMPLIGIYSGINLIDLFMKNTYYSRRTNQAYLAKYINLLASTLAIQLQLLFLDKSRITAILFFLIVIIPCSWRMSASFIDRYYLNLDHQIEEILQRSKNDSGHTAHSTKDVEASFSQRDIDYHLDYFTRTLLDKSEFFKKKQKVMLSLYEKTQSFHDPSKLQSDESQSLHLGQLIDFEEATAISSLKSQVKVMMEYLNCKERLKSSPKQERASVSMWELFYLLEIEVNLPKLAIRIQKYISSSKQLKLRRSIQEYALIRLLQDSMDDIETKVRKAAAIASISSQKTKAHRVDYLHSTHDNDFSTAFSFQEDIKNIENTIVKALKLKLIFLNGISHEPIDLEDIGSKGSQLITLIKQISLLIFQSKLKNHASNQLYILTHVFVENLWLDSMDYKLKLLPNIHQSHAQGSSKSLDFIMQSMHKASIYHRMEDLTEQNHDSVVILVSLSEKKFGKIIKVSDKCEHMTGYTASELIDQYCGILQPTAIQIHHSQILRRGIECGIQRVYSSTASPLIMKHKAGYGVRVSLELQVSVIHGSSGFSEIGFAGRLKQDEWDIDQENYILIDVMNSRARIEVISQHLYERLFGYYFNALKDINDKELAQILPAAVRLGEFMVKHAVDNQLEFQSLLFMPTTQQSFTKRRMQDQSKDVLDNAKKHYYDRSKNDIFLVNFKATRYARQGEYELILLTINDFKQISDNLECYSRTTYAAHLVQFAGITQEVSAQIVDSIVQGTNNCSEDITTNTLRYVDDSKNKLSLTESVKQYAKITTTSRATGLTQEDSSENLLFQKQSNNSKQFAYQMAKFPANSETRIPSMLTQNSPSRVDCFDQQNNMNTQLAINTNRTIEQNLNSTRIQSSSRLFVNQLTNCISPTSDRQSLNESKAFLEGSKQQLYRQTSFQIKVKESNSNLLKLNDENFIPMQDSINVSVQQAACFDKNNTMLGSIQVVVSPKTMIQNRNKNAYDNTHNNPFSKNSTMSNNGGKNSRRASISSQQSSQKSDILRDALFKGISDQQNSTLQLNLMLFIVAIFIGIITIVCVVYLNIRNSISTQEISFKFSWWQDKIQDSTISILRLSEAYSLIQYTQMGGTSSDLQTFKDSISSSTQSLYEDCMNQFQALYQHDYNDLYLVELLHTMKMQYQRYIDRNDYYNQTYSMLQVFELYAYSSYQYAIKQFNLKLIVELEIVSNMDNVSSTISGVSDSQTNNENELIDEMKSTVMVSLILILSISLVIACIIMLFYAAFQKKQQKILCLFSTISGDGIKSMYQESLQGIKSIKQTKSSNNLQGEGDKQSNGIDHQELKQQQVSKTKQLLSTTYLPKIHLRFVIQVVTLLVVINIQPFVNQILIYAQLSESEQELAIVKSLYQLSTAFVYAQYAIYATTEKTAAPFTTQLSISVFETKVTESVAKVETSIQQLQKTILTLSQSSSEMAVFIKNVFNVNACDTLNSAKAAYFDNNGGLTYNNTLCQTLYDGILVKGYLNAVKAFENIFDTYEETMNLDVDSQEKTTLFTNFYNENTPLEMENLFTMIKIISSAVVNCISEEKESYYEKLNHWQLGLFIFQVAFVILLFPIAVYPFFLAIKRKMVEVVEIIQVLQIHHIQENSYICSFIKSGQKQR